jgi:hypothetical protein
MQFLTADQKQQSVSVCEEIHQIASDDETFLSRVISGDPETKQDSPPVGKKVRQVKSKVKSMLIIFFHIKRLFMQNSSWQAQRLIPHTAVMFYGDCMKICEDFSPNVGSKTTGCCIMTVHNLTLPFSPGNFLPKTT